jgi:hypothetical protein
MEPLDVVMLLVVVLGEGDFVEIKLSMMVKLLKGMVQHI